MVKENTNDLDLMVFVPLSALLIMIIPVIILPIESNTLSTKFVLASSDNVDGEGEVNTDTKGGETDEDQQENNQNSNSQQSSSQQLSIDSGILSLSPST